MRFNYRYAETQRSDKDISDWKKNSNFVFYFQPPRLCVSAVKSYFFCYARLATIAGMPESGTAVQSFAYQAQTTQGQTLTGTIDAADVDSASRMLESLQLRVTAMEPTPKPKNGGAMLRGADFLAFNQQLSHLTAGGLPVERSLRLLAREMRGRQAAAVNAIAEELEKGAPLEAAFAKYATVFPPLYGMLIQAGMKTSDLPGMLLNLGRHVEMIQRLRASFWRAATYPLAVLTALLVVLAFLWSYVIPQFSHVVSDDFSREFNFPSDQTWDWLIPLARQVSGGVMIAVAFILLATLFFVIVSRTPAGKRMTERVLLRMPVIAPILRLNLLARWCDALSLAVNAGLDLPGSLLLAGNAVGSGRLLADSQTLAGAVSAGQPIDTKETRFLPLVVPTALRLGAEHHDLPATSAMLAKMYQEQAEIRMSILPQVLTPIFMILTAVCIALALVAAILPVIAFVRLISGSIHF
jgi:type II secretory pathway component PulF